MIIGVHGISLEMLTKLSTFLYLFGREYLENVVCKLTSENLDSPMQFGKFLRFLGIWLLIVKSSSGSSNRRNFWSEKPVSRRNGAPFRFNNLMITTRVENITSKLVFTNQDPPFFKDRFWEIR